MLISKQELEFLVFLRQHPELSLNSPQLRERFSNPHVPYNRILEKSPGRERKISDFVAGVREVQLFLDKHDKSISPRPDARELLAGKALDAIPVDKFEDFLSRYKAKVQRQTAIIPGNARVVPDEKTRALFEKITSHRRWVRAFAYFAGLIEKSDITNDLVTGYMGGIKRFLMAKKLIARDGKLTPQGKRIVDFFKDEIITKAKPPRPATRRGRKSGAGA